MLCIYLLESSDRGDSKEYTQHTHHIIEDRKDITKLSPFVSWPCAMLNPQWLELPMPRTKFHGPIYVRVIEVLQYELLLLNLLRFRCLNRIIVIELKARETYDTYLGTQWLDQQQILPPASDSITFLSSSSSSSSDFRLLCSFLLCFSLEYWQ